MKKKVIAILMVAIMTMGLAGCAETTTDTTTETPVASEKTDVATETESTEKIHITYAQWGSEEEAQNTQKSIDRFNDSQETIEVECIPIPWETYMEKLNTMATADELPDCAIMSEAGVIQWAQQGMLYDISSMYDGSDSKPIDSLAFTYEGKPVAYSTAFETILLFYNKDMFDKAGVEYPSFDSEKAYSWDEFVEVAKKLTLDKNGKTPNDVGFDKDNIVQYGCMIENLTWQLEVWCLSNGSGFFSEDGTEVIIDDPAAIEALQKIADLYLVEHVAPLSSGLTDDGVSRSLIAGTCAMTTNGAWNIGTCLSAARDEGLNYGIGVLPYMEEKVTINTGGPNVVFSQSEHPKEAMEFLKWYALEENNWDALIATGIWMPTLDSYYTDETLTHKWLDNPAYPVYEESKGVLVDFAMNYSRPASWYYTNNTVDFNSLLASVLGDVWTGKTTVETAINENIASLEAAHAGE
jgi:multiple sugar transport system substrate-binding protein